MKAFSALACFVFSIAATASSYAAEQALPNILWITSEDNGPQLGCYGDVFATTPNLDRLSAKGMRYFRCWSVAPVCAPARTTLISGMYPSSTGSEHMRSDVKLPAAFRMYPQELRDAGYYCTNNAKEDYNLEKRGKVWDNSSKNGHWRNRPAGSAFFAVFNIEDTHESQIRKRPHTFVHDPTKVPVPAYHPDCPEVRESWAQYHDQMTVMDRKAGALLADLEADGLAQDTIVFYYGDHGPGLARCKRTPCHSGLNVPLIVYFPDKWKHLAPKEYAPGGSSDRLVSFVDFAPTLLSISGLKAPSHYQGVAFAGAHAGPPREFNYGLRGRMDERYDLVRSVTDGRHVYLRNYMPHKPWGQHNAYMFETPMTRAWQKLAQDGKLPPHLTYFWGPKAPEELYDLKSDPFETRNLAGGAEHDAVLKRLRAANDAHLLRIRDVDLLPEAEMLARTGDGASYDLGHDAARYPIERVLEAANRASLLKPDAIPALVEGLTDKDSGVRYWSVLGLQMRGADAVKGAESALAALLDDASPSVRVAAAEALAKFGSASTTQKAIDVLMASAEMTKNPYYASIAALNALDELDAKVADRRGAIEKLTRSLPTQNQRTRDYGERLVAKTLADLGAK